MSNVLTEWRVALMAHLREEMPDPLSPIERDWVVRAGERDGASSDEHLIHVWIPGMRPDDASVLLLRPTLMVRAWIAKPPFPGQEHPDDPERVEQLQYDLNECLGAGRETLPGGYHQVAAIDADYDDWGVQALLVGWIDDNPAEL